MASFQLTQPHGEREPTIVVELNEGKTLMGYKVLSCESTFLWLVVRHLKMVYIYICSKFGDNKVNETKLIKQCKIHSSSIYSVL